MATVDLKLWRAHQQIAKHLDGYAEWRRVEYPRSCNQVISMLKRFTLPYFISVLRLRDPNQWCEYGVEFSDWLLLDAKCRDGEPLSESFKRGILSATNQFFKWLRRKKIIDQKNFRQFEVMSSNRRKVGTRTSKDLVSDAVFHEVHKYLKQRNELYADLWYVQRKMGFRVTEMLGLPFGWVSDQCPTFLKDEFEAKGFRVYGSVYLESQPAKAYIKRKNNHIERVPLKGRPSISVEHARTIPVIDGVLWDILCRRYEIQCDLWEAKVFGNSKLSYLLFDGAQGDTFRENIKEAYAYLGLESDGTHVLRHTLATEWASLRINESTSELILGHKAAAHQLYVHIVGQVNSERLNAAPMPRLRKSVEK